jgi:poly(3-hydroxybutyrate) depolymerase
MKTHSNNNNYLYYGVETLKAGFKSMNFMLQASQDVLSSYSNMNDTPYLRIVNAMLTMGIRLTKEYKKPRFNIKECEVDGKIIDIQEKIILSKTFCILKRFKKLEYKKPMPKLLIVAPMAGHHPTLLRNTVEEMLPYCDVYITDWISANKVPASEGNFNVDNFIDYLIEFMQHLGPDLHVMAVCQPTVPVLAATSIMAKNNDPHVPSSLILMGGPIDARKRPTKVDMFAKNKSVEWFEQMVTMTVPPSYKGHGREVYPGFLQLAGFMSMDMGRHINSHIDLFFSLANGDKTNAERISKFYDEYLSIMDLPAEFYLQTIEEVFKDFALAKGKFVSRDREVHLEDITKTAILAVEGEKDDIAAVGQTKAVLNLCKNVPDNMKQYHLEPNVGHYGVFSGSKFKKFIVPEICNFIYSQDKNFKDNCNNKDHKHDTNCHIPLNIPVITDIDIKQGKNIPDVPVFSSGNNIINKPI